MCITHLRSLPCSRHSITLPVIQKLDPLPLALGRLYLGFHVSSVFQRLHFFVFFFSTFDPFRYLASPFSVEFSRRGVQRRRRRRQRVTQRERGTYLRADIRGARGFLG